MRFAAILIVLSLALPATALAWFGLIIPSNELIRQRESPAIGLRLGLFDPLAPAFTELAKPKRFGVQHLGEATELLATLKPSGEKQPTAWLAEFAAKNPGDYTFYTEFAPRWEATDDQFTISFAKVCVNALAREEGWR